MEVQALLNTNPAEALKRLLPIVQELQGFTGDRLPADLQKEVDAGDMKFERAKELAQLRAQNKFGQVNAQRTQQQLEAQQLAEVKRQYSTASGEWERTKRATDPNYQPKKSENAPDGMWEDTRHMYLAILNDKHPDGSYKRSINSPAEMVKLMEECYQAQKTKWSRWGGVKPATKKKLSSNGGGGKQDEETVEGAKTMADAIKVRLAERAK